MTPIRAIFQLAGSCLLLVLARLCLPLTSDDLPVHILYGVGFAATLAAGMLLSEAVDTLRKPEV